MKNRMKQVMTVLAVSACLAFLACGNREKHTLPIDDDHLFVIERSASDTATMQSKEDTTKAEEKPSAPVKSSSSSSSSSSSVSSAHHSGNDDNMRGFDPASEDDMEDNGMSRYMENNDDEGWD